MLRLLVLVLGIMSFPLASASGSVVTPVATVVMVDNHGYACTAPVAGLCPYNLTGDGTLGSTNVDAYQRIDYVGVATNFSFLPGDPLRGYEQSETLQGSDIYVRYPVLRMLTETWQAGDLHHPGMEYVAFDLLPEATVVHHPWPSPAAPLGTRNTSFFYSPGGVGYEQLGPYNTPTGSSTDTYLFTNDNFACAAPTPECHERVDGIHGTGRAATPNVQFGLEFYDTHVATDPKALASPQLFRDPPDATLGPLLRPNSSSQELRSSPTPRVLPDGASSSNPPEAAGPRRDQGNVPPILPLPSTASIPAAAAPSPTSPLAVVAAAAATVLVAILWAAFYSRFQTKSDLLASETRAKILDFVRQEPGCTFRDLGAHAGISRTAVVYHLDFLQKMRLVQLMTVNRKQLAYLVGEAPPARPDVTSGIQSMILDLLLASPEGRTREEIAKAFTQVPRTSRNHSIRRLLQRGAVHESTCANGGRLLRASGALRQ